jgi:hypothetical protein
MERGAGEGRTSRTMAAGEAHLWRCPGRILLCPLSTATGATARPLHELRERSLMR